MVEAETSERRRILIVDDEPGVLNAVRRELSTRPLGRHRYQIETFSDPRAALERARVQPFEVAVSDYRMPEMSGLDFLKGLAAIQDNCVCIVLSGQTDFDTLVQMIDETPIYRYIPKPWNSCFLKSCVAHAVDFRDAYLENRRLADLLRRRGDGLPQAAGDGTDRIMVVADTDVAEAVLRTLRQRSRLDDGYRAFPGDAVAGGLGTAFSRVAIAIADSTAAVLEMAEGAGCSCVVVDLRSAGMDRARFISSLGAMQPDCAVTILTQAGELEQIGVAPYLPRIHGFVTAPWAEFELRAAVAHGLTQRRLMLEHRAMTRMCRIDDPGNIE